MTVAAPPATPALRGEVTVLDDVGPAHARVGHRGAVGVAGLVAAAFGLVGALVLWPVLRTVHASLTDPRDGFVGWRHFRATWTAGADGVVAQTVAWAVVVPLAVTAVGMLLAYGSRRRRWRYRRALASVLVSPIALPLVVTGVAFRILYDPDPRRGAATRLAEALPVDVPAWLGPRWITLALMSAFVWAWVGLAFVVFRAALDQLPREYADAVGGYGGTRWEVLRDARWLPQVRRIVAVVLALVAVSTARTFDLILAMAPGSVTDEASVLAVLQWQTSGATTSGPAAALGVLWLAVVAAGVLLAAVWSRPPRWRSRWDGERRLRRRVRDRRERRGGSHGGVLPVRQPGGPGAASARSGRGMGWIAGRAGSLVAFAALAVWMLPLLALAATSLHAPREAATSGWWTPPYGLGSYGRLRTAGIVASLQLTAMLAVGVAVAVLVLALVAVRGLADMPPAGATAVVVLFLAAAVVPVQVVAGPITEVLDWVGLTGQLSRLRLALVHTALGVPLAVVVLWSARVQPSLARFRTAWRATPSRWARPRALLDAEPALVAVFVLVFVQVWNDFAVGLLFGGPNAVPLGLRLYGETRQFVANAGVLAAGSIVGSVVPLLVLVLNHRRMVAGLVGSRPPL